MVITTFFTLIIAYIFTKKIPKVALFSGIILGIFGSLTIFFENEIFIKIKPTIVNLLFAGVLIYGNLSKKPLISNLLEGQIRMSNAAWLILSRRWAIFFIFLAILNEVIWRGFPTEFWVKFKVFGIMPLSMIFTFFQIPFMMREMKKEKPANIQ
jgi:intracellular septation protein